MSINLLETVQQNLGYPPLQKIDPNTQKVKTAEEKPMEDKFSQAAIPAVLAALYEYVQSDEGATEVLQVKNSSNWTAQIFSDNKKEIMQSILNYADENNEQGIAKMNAIANEAVKVSKENLPETGGIKEVKLFFSNQIKDILLYLPASLNMGALLHDNTLDDNTNKMEGPVSSLLKSIGSAFSTPVTGDEIKTQ